MPDSARTSVDVGLPFGKYFASRGRDAFVRRRGGAFQRQRDAERSVHTHGRAFEKEQYCVVEREGLRRQDARIRWAEGSVRRRAAGDGVAAPGLPRAVCGAGESLNAGANPWAFVFNAKAQRREDAKN